MPLTEGPSSAAARARLRAGRLAGRAIALLGAGARDLLTRAAARWGGAGGHQRLAVAGGAVAAVAAAALLPWLAVLYGVLVSGCALAAGARAERAEQRRRADAAQRADHDRLGMVVAALEPFFGPVHAAREAPDAGEGAAALAGSAFADGRLVSLRLRYPPRFPDTDQEARSAVERVLAAKLGPDREMRAAWDTEGGELAVTVPDPLPREVAAQRFVTGPGEVVLGFTDAEAVHRTIPVREGPDATVLGDAAPVLWRTGARCAAAHLLAVGTPGAGVSSLLRSVALQGLAAGGDVLLLDGAGAGGFGEFTGRPGVLAVECAPMDAVGALDWVARETQRRLRAAAARQRPLWVLVDGVAALAHRARLASAADPQELLEVPLRHGRAGGVTVVAAEQLAALPGLTPTVWAAATARVVLGAVPAGYAADVLGAPLGGSPASLVPPGRGYARIGDGPVRRLQVPATPDPVDPTAAAWQRSAVAALLPEVPGAAHRPAGSAAGG